MGEPAVQTQGLTRRFGSVCAVRDLGLTVPQGSVHGLVGPDGAGKTTILRLLLGLLQPSAGSALVLACNPATQGEEVRCRSGVVLEPCGLYDQLSALENLDYFGRIWHMPDRDRVDRAQELLQRLRLWDRRHEIVAPWGRGLRQRLCLARSLMHRPPLLILDEPTAGLDASALDENVAYLRELVTRTGLTVLIATNNVAVTQSICQSVSVLNHGRVIAGGRLDEICCKGVAPSVEIDGRGFSEEVIALLLRRPEVASARRAPGGLIVQLAARVDTAPLVSLLIESGAEICEVRRSDPSLQQTVEALLQQESLQGAQP